MSAALKQPLDQYMINGTAPINAQELAEQSLLSAEQAECETTGRNTLWQAGVSGNPKGRPKGSLNKIQALFYDDLYADWQNHGIQAIEQMRIDSPKAYVQVVASILPKSLEIESDGTRWVINAAPGLSSSEWLAMHKLTQPIDAQAIESAQDTGEDSIES